MAVDAATRKSQNVKRSVQSYLAGLTLTWTDQDPQGAGATSAAPVLYDAPLDAVPKAGAWVDARWGVRQVDTMASAQREVKWVLLLDCWSRIKNDPMAAQLDALADALLAALRNGSQDKRIPLYDYTNPAVPVDSGYGVRLTLDGDDTIPATDLVFGRSITVGVHYYERY